MIDKPTTLHMSQDVVAAVELQQRRKYDHIFNFDEEAGHDIFKQVLERKMGQVMVDGIDGHLHFSDSEEYQNMIDEGDEKRYLLENGPQEEEEEEEEGMVGEITPEDPRYHEEEDWG